MTTTAEGNAPVLLRARTDLEVETQPNGFVLKDPKKNSFIRLGVAEYLVFRMFDGESTPQQIVDRLKTERDVVASVAHVERLRDRLHEKQLIIGPDEVVIAEDASVGDSSSLVQRLIIIDFGLAFDPDRALTRLFHRIKYVVFRPAFFVCLGALLLISFQVWLESWDDLRRQTATLDVKDSFFIYYGCVMVSVFLHETGHGVATRGFGGPVPKMGAFLYFFVVVFYTDVSSSWMFRSKFRRLMVLFAGAIVNLAILAVSTILWRCSIQGSLPNQIFFAFMVVNAFIPAFTLFPLLRGDGYYILSTALDLPNLRDNANKYTAALLRRTLVDRKTELPKATHKEALVYLWFSPIQWLFFIGFFGYVATKTALWLVGSFGLLGFLAVCLVLVDRVGRPVLRLAPGTLGLLAQALRLGFAEGVRAQVALFARPVRAASRWLWQRKYVFLLIAAPIALVALLPYDLHVSAPTEVISRSPVTVRPLTGGVVERFTVRTGDAVRAGDVVARLLDDDLVHQRDQLVASRDEAKAAVAELEAGFRLEEIAKAAARLRRERSELGYARRELERLRPLAAAGIESRRTFELGEAAVGVAAAQVGQAEAQLRLLRHGERPEEVDRARARVRVIEARLARVEQRLAWCDVRAPHDGRVLTPLQDLAGRVGEYVPRGDSLLELVAPDSLAARVQVPEQFVPYVHEGMTVSLRFAEDPGVTYTAKVDAIEARVSLPAAGAPGAILRADARTDAVAGARAAAGAPQPPSGASVGVLVHLVDGAPRLGSVGVAKFDGGSVSVLGLLAHRAQREGGVAFWSWW